MWTIRYTAVTELGPEPIWSALRDLHSGAEPDPGGDRFALHGDFAVGSTVSVTPDGQDTFTSEITELVENERYADRTEFNGLILTFRYRLSHTEVGTEISHEVAIDGADADQAGADVGAQISADFPATMAALLRRAAGEPATSEPTAENGAQSGAATVGG